MSEIRKDNIATPKGEWATPEKLYRHLDKEFHFDADAAANSKNTKHPGYFTKSMNSLSFNWKDMIDFKPTDQKPHPVFFLNPDYATERDLRRKAINRFSIEQYQVNSGLTRRRGAPKGKILSRQGGIAKSGFKDLKTDPIYFTC